MVLEAGAGDIAVTSEMHMMDVMARLRPAHVVCFGSPARPAARPDAPHVLLLDFHDIGAPRDGHVAPGRGHVAELIAFARGWTGATALVCQCWMGVSRSTAGALIAAAARGGDPLVLARRMRAASPSATPNPLMLAHADALLGLDGALVAAGRAIGRGAVPIARPFVLRSGP